ncbi:MAG: UDP-N-acetylmuramoyl-L-alanine--D-glutamate ligase [Sorangiineae bacterium]|nr:UDP-N-acetylmuramoyl-L-alanine--D-glutamate ligase [Polyangiaceae bacterium]MEB2322743.1 UDP-N-acetylmuramoyl-L-alanine--D-glutamate ligase [Sorangiineae bacterium]
MELEGKRVVVVGLGRSGVSAARLCRARGAEVVATDSAPDRQLSPEARALDVTLVAGGHQGVRFEEADLIVVSPGVPTFAELAAAEAAGVPVIGELELAGRLVTAPIVLIGGTNGKSTTTTLAARLLEAAGARVFAGGNLGTPLSEAVGGDYDVLVVEASSFQLERVPTLHAHVNVLLNITEDHLDRYSSFDEYARAKGNGFVSQTAGDVAIIPAGDALCAREAGRGRARVVTFGEGGDFTVDGDEVVEGGTRYSLAQSELHGRHNYSNAAAAIAAARALRTPPELIEVGLARFHPLAHRMALAGVVRGIRFYDDSKGTNVGAAVTALTGLAEPRAVLIAGGRDKLGAYEPLVEALARHGRAAVLIGEATERIASAIGDRLPVRRAADLTEAVRLALELAEPGDAVLLSPACSSFDMFASYAERGERFVAAVRELAEVAS